MTDILALRNQPVLERYASSNLLVAFDYDGTLAPIVSAPDRAHMRPQTRRLLKGVARRYPCVVISGRSRDDLYIVCATFRSSTCPGITGSSRGPKIPATFVRPSDGSSSCHPGWLPAEAW